VRLMLDAHTLIWAVDDPATLGSQAATALQTPGNDLLLSAGTIWEVAIKVGLGKLVRPAPARLCDGRPPAGVRADDRLLQGLVPVQCRQPPRQDLLREQRLPRDGVLRRPADVLREGAGGVLSSDYLCIGTKDLRR